MNKDRRKANIEYRTDEHRMMKEGAGFVWTLNLLYAFNMPGKCEDTFVAPNIEQVNTE